MDNRPDALLPVTPEQVAVFAGRISPVHRREILATGGLSPRAALEASVAASLEAYAYQPRGAAAPFFMFGVEPAGSITGAAMLWMLAAPDIVRAGAGTVRAARWGLARAFRITGAHCLEQYIPEWYGVGLRFARRLGFVAEPCSFCGRDGAAMLRVFLERGQFERRKKWVR